MNAPVACPACHLVSRPGSQFCDNCGELLDSSVSVTPSGAQELQRVGPLPAGTRLRGGRYTIERHLAQGGMGTVYLAHDANKGMRCVVKELLPKSDPVERADAETLFEREASVLAELHHPQIVAVWDYFKEDSNHYLVMEEVPGGDLTRLVEQPGALSEPRAIEIATQIAEAFEYIHTHYRTAPPGSVCTGPLIYRDMKPANVMLRADGSVVVADFGIVRLFKPGKRSDTINFGSSGYAAPEMMAGRGSDVRSDIYTLGATLHELLTKRDPANNPNAFAPVRSLRPDVSPTFEAIITKTLQTRPEDRHQTASELLTELRVLREGWRAAACPGCGHRNTPGVRACARCRTALTAVTAQNAEIHGGSARLGAFGAAPGGDYHTAWQVHLGSPVRGAATVHEGRVMLATQAGNLDVLDVRDGRGVARVPLGAPSRSTPVVTAHGVLVGTQDGLVLCDLGTRTAERLPVPPAEVFAVPATDGRERAFAGTYDGQVLCVDLRSRSVVWSARAGTSVLGAVAFDDRHVAVTSRNGQVTLLHAESGQILWQRQVGQEVYASAALAADAVLVLDTTSRVSVLDRTRGTPLMTMRPGGTTHNAPAVATDVFTVDTAGRCQSRSLNGVTRWERQVFERVIASPTVVGTRLVVPTRTGKLFLLSTATGDDTQPALEFPGANNPSLDFVSPVVADGNTIIAVDQAGHVLALVH